MNGLIEKVIESLEKKRDEAKKNMQLSESLLETNEYGGIFYGFDKSIKIVKQAAEEYNNGWIPCSERLPSDCANREVTAQLNNGKLYTELAYYDEARKEWWNHDGLLNVIAWKESSEPYQPKGEK